MSPSHAHIRRLQGIAEDTRRASTLEQVDALYEALVGYRPSQDDPSMTFEEVRALLDARPAPDRGHAQAPQEPHPTGGHRRPGCLSPAHRARSGLLGVRSCTFHREDDMARRLLATVKNHEAHRCSKVYRDTILRQYVVVFLAPKDPDPPPDELRTPSREEAYVAAWGFAWPKDPSNGSVPTK
jgi:hypothetical protein